MLSQAVKMTKLEDIMDSDHLSNCLTGEFLDGLHHSTSKSDGFVVDMERFSHLIEKEANSRIKRKLSRKGSSRTAERKFADNETDGSMLATSPRATFNGGSVPNKLAVEAPRPHGHSIAPQVHHQITISSGSLSSMTVAENKSAGKRFTFRRSSPAWFIDPTRILYFFATLSCMGTILLIYFTLSMGKLKEGGNATS